MTYRTIVVEFIAKELHTRPMATKKKIVTYEGYPGAYSHMAALACFPKTEAKGFVTFDAGVEAVQRGEADYAFVPIENSTAGRISYMHLLLGSGVRVVGEHFQPVRHCLIAKKGTKMRGIKRVFSHREALAQCKKYIHKMKFEAIPRGDTAGALKYVMEENQPDMAAIASEKAAEQYKDAAILEKGVQDEADNVTRFVIVAREPLKNPGDKGVITSIVYKTKDVPAALFKTLSGFATTSTNIIKLESFVPMTRHTEAVFYLEFEGNPTSYPCSVAMDELRFYSRHVEILGTYPKSPYRKKFNSA